jgi:hypothetical protein
MDPYAMPPSSQMPEDAWPPPRPAPVADAVEWQASQSASIALHKLVACAPKPCTSPFPTQPRIKR